MRSVYSYTSKHSFSFHSMSSRTSTTSGGSRGKSGHGPSIEVGNGVWPPRGQKE